jgi:hypothetical protein
LYADKIAHANAAIRKGGGLTLIVARRPQGDTYPKLDVPTSPDKNALPINVSGKTAYSALRLVKKTTAYQ